MSERVKSSKICKGKISKLLEQIQADPKLAASLDLLEDTPPQTSKSEFNSLYDNGLKTFSLNYPLCFSYQREK